MRTKLFVPIAALFLVIVLLAGCTAATSAPKPNVKLEPATLQGQSEHWKVNVTYLVKDQALEEVTSIQFIGVEEVDEASVTIEHKEQSPLTYHVANPGLLKGGQAITLAERAKVLSWENTERIAVDWKIGSIAYKEYITPTKKEAAATR